MEAATVRRSGSTPPPYRVALHAYSVVVATCTLLLVCSGGMVTSRDAGMSVPDWPNTYGYNMFAFPISRWVGGVFFEHTHRLLASFVGLLTLGLAIWLWRVESRRWVRRVGYAAVGAVILQGVLGGLRVTMVKDWIGVPHALLAQAFFALVAFLALTQSRWWQRLGRPAATGAALPETVRPLRRTVAVVTALIFLQLGFGAAMRHAHAGLSILDFPTAYGHWWPRVHPADMPAINQHRVDDLHMMPTTFGQIHLQMSHRVLAAIILLGVLWVAGQTWRRRTTLPSGLRVLGLGWPLLLAGQITLGMYTIWTRKAADVATAHVAVGAASLVWGVITYTALHRWSMAAPAVLALRVRQPVFQTAEVLA